MPDEFLKTQSLLASATAPPLKLPPQQDDGRAEKPGVERDRYEEHLIHAGVRLRA